MKRIMYIMAVLALISVSVQAAGPKVEMKTSGPSGQGNLIWWAPSTGTTNLEMTTTGLKNVTLAEALSIPSLVLTGNASVGGALSVTGDATITGGDVTGAKTNSIDIGEIADGQFTLKRSNSGTVTLTTLDDDANAALTIEAGGNGALKLGATDSTTEISSSDWTIGTDGTIAGASMDAAQLSGNIAVARVTNLLAGSSYEVSAARLTAGSAVSAINLASATNLPTAGITLGGANIKSMLDCADYSAVRTALGVRPGTEVQAYDADLDTLALNNGGSLTNLNGSVVASGTVPAARLGTNLEKLSLNNGSSLTNLVVAAFPVMQTGQLLIGDSDGIPDVSTMGGDGSILANGTFSINNKAVQADDIEITGGYILIGDAGATGTCVAVTGDITIAIDGTTTIGSGTVHAGMLDATIVTNVLAGGMVLPAVDGSAVTNLAGGNIASGNIAATRITNALGTSGASIGGNIPLAALTNALSPTLYSGTYTNDSTLGTNTIVVLNGVIVSVTRTP